jgi:hypothetical protein
MIAIYKYGEFEFYTIDSKKISPLPCMSYFDNTEFIHYR